MRRARLRDLDPPPFTGEVAQRAEGDALPSPTYRSTTLNICQKLVPDTT